MRDWRDINNRKGIGTSTKLKSIKKSKSRRRKSRRKKRSVRKSKSRRKKRSVRKSKSRRKKRSVRKSKSRRKKRSVRKSKSRRKKRSVRKSKSRRKKRSVRINKSRGKSVCGTSDEQNDYNEVILNSEWELNSDSSCINDDDIKYINQVLKVILKDGKGEYKTPKNIQFLISKMKKKLYNPLIPLEASNYSGNDLSKFGEMVVNANRPVYLLELDNKTSSLELPQKLVLKAGKDYEIYEQIKKMVPTECMNGLIPVARVKNNFVTDCPETLLEVIDPFNIQSLKYLSVTKLYDYDLRQFAEKNYFLTNLIKHVVNIGKILLCLQNNGFYYADLKLENIFVCDYGENSQVWLGDIDGTCSSDKSCISTFPAPEALVEIFELANGTFNSTKYDMEKILAWQFGILLLEIIFSNDKNSANLIMYMFYNNFVGSRYIQTKNTKFGPFDEIKINGKKLSISILCKMAEMHVGTASGLDLVLIIRNLLEINPEDRITLEEGVENLERILNGEHISDNLKKKIKLLIVSRKGEEYEFLISKYATIKTLKDILLKQIPEYTQEQSRLVYGGSQISDEENSTLEELRIDGRYKIFHMAYF